MIISMLGARAADAQSAAATATAKRDAAMAKRGIASREAGHCHVTAGDHCKKRAGQADVQLAEDDRELSHKKKGFRLQLRSQPRGVSFNARGKGVSLNEPSR